MSEEQTEKAHQRTSVSAPVLLAKGSALKTPPCAGRPQNCAGAPINAN